MIPVAMSGRPHLALAAVSLVAFVVGAPAACGGSDLPPDCEGDGALFTDACAAALDERCAAHGEEDDCEHEPSLDFGDLGAVRCARARGVSFTDVEGCVVGEISERCFAFIDTSDGTDRSCSYDQCASDEGDRRTYLTPIERDGLLIRRPCGLSKKILKGPVLAGVEGDVAPSCSPEDGAPPAICACTELACAQLQ